MSTVPTTNTIDFLPAKYREATAKRKTQAWRVVVVAAFGVLLVAAAIGQYGIRYSVMSELERIRLQHAAAVDEQAQLATLGQELRPHRAEANLLAYLDHPWPASQAIAAAVGPLPETVTLDKLTIYREQGVQPPKAPLSEDEATAIAAAPSAERDLAKLRDETDHAPLVLKLEGTTRDIVDLHTYLSKVAASGMFRSAELSSLQRPENSNIDVSRFTAQLVILPGYGQPDGPRELPAKQEPTAPKESVELSAGVTPPEAVR